MLRGTAGLQTPMTQTQVCSCKLGSARPGHVAAAGPDAKTSGRVVLNAADAAGLPGLASCGMWQCPARVVGL